MDIINQIDGKESQKLQETLRTSEPLYQFTDEQKSLTHWFFFRLQQIFLGAYDAQFSDEKSIALAKREWCLPINRFTREELHVKLELMKKQGDMQYPDIKKILAIPIGRAPSEINSQAYKISAPALPLKRNKDEAKARISKLRDIIG